MEFLKQIEETSVMDYERETRSAYRNKRKAKDYQEQYKKGLKWARFTMWRERVIIKRLLKECDLKGDDKILDFPHGTGILIHVLANMPSSYIAADISREMMSYASEENVSKKPLSFIQGDITNPPFKHGSFACVITLSLMHRLPDEIRKMILDSIKNVAERNIIISYSVDSGPQRFKKWLINIIKPKHEYAPRPIPLRDIMAEITLSGLKIRKFYHIASFLSAEVIFFLEKR